ncbi:MAG: translation initiation factor IF-6 [Candidatus Heimdallarchaeaceae archaeon]
MEISKGTILGNSGIGIFGLATDKYAIVPFGIKETTKELIEKTLECKIIQNSVANTVLLGTMLAGNSKTLLIPPNMTETEYNNFSQLGELDVEIVEIKSKYTALGNLILLNDKGAVISEIFEKKAQKQIEDALGIETTVGNILSSPLVGTTGLATNRGCLVHPLTTEEEKRELASLLKVKVDLTTVNRGVPYPKIGIIANSTGAFVGEDTTGPESMRIFELLLSSL